MFLFSWSFLDSGCVVLSVFFFKQNPAYEVRISYWSSDVCSSDLPGIPVARRVHPRRAGRHAGLPGHAGGDRLAHADGQWVGRTWLGRRRHRGRGGNAGPADEHADPAGGRSQADGRVRSEENTSELQSIMRNTYAVFCLKKKKI